MQGSPRPAMGTTQYRGTSAWKRELDRATGAQATSRTSIPINADLSSRVSSGLSQRVESPADRGFDFHGKWRYNEAVFRLPTSSGGALDCPLGLENVPRLFWQVSQEWTEALRGRPVTERYSIQHV